MLKIKWVILNIFGFNTNVNNKIANYSNFNINMINNSNIDNSNKATSRQCCENKNMLFLKNGQNVGTIKGAAKDFNASFCMPLGRGDIDKIKKINTKIINYINNLDCMHKNTFNNLLEAISSLKGVLEYLSFCVFKWGYLLYVTSTHQGRSYFCFINGKFIEVIPCALNIYKLQDA